MGSRRWSCGPAAPVTAGEALGLAVAVGAQQLQVLQAVVVSVAVDVMKGKGQRLAEPSIDATTSAAWIEQARADEPQLQVASLAPPGQEPVDGHGLGPGDDIASAAGVVPRLARKP